MKQLKMQPSENYSKQKNAAQRITAVFLELLERQFPIESTERPLQLKTAQDFAQEFVCSRQLFKQFRKRSYRQTYYCSYC